MSDVSKIINEKVDKYFDEILEALKKVIAIKSVMSEPKMECLLVRVLQKLCMKP